MLLFYLLPFNKTTKDNIQKLRPLSIPHRDEPEDVVVEVPPQTFIPDTFDPPDIPPPDPPEPPGPTVPDKVTGVEVDNVPDSHTELLVSWDVPPVLYNGGATIDMYEVRYIDLPDNVDPADSVDPADNEDALNQPVLGENTDNAILPELTPGTFYCVQVRAHNNSGVDIGNGLGWGDWSDVVKHPTTADTVPDKVTGCSG